MAVVMCMGIFSCMACNSAAGNGKNKGKRAAVTEQRSVRYFKAVESSLACDIYFTQTDGSSSVKLVGSRRDIDRVKCEVDANGVLRLTDTGFDNILRGKDDGELKVYLSSPDLVAINMRGAGDFKVLTPIDTDTLRMEQRGAGDVEFERPVSCDELYVTLYGTGDSDFEKVCAQKVDMQIFGVGDIEAKLFKVPMVSFILKGTGDIEAELDGCGQVSSSLYGVGNIELKGSADSFISNEKGTGRIDTTELTVRKAGSAARR